MRRSYHIAWQSGGVTGHLSVTLPRRGRLTIGNIAELSDEIQADVGLKGPVIITSIIPLNGK